MRTDFDRIQTKENHEEKSFLTFGFELKEVKQDDEKYFHVEGYASTFHNEDRGGDVVLPGAFRKSIKEFTPMFLFSHNHDKLIGIIDEIHEDEKGLFIKARCPRGDTFVAGHVIPQVDIGSVKSMSIGYYAIESEYDSEDDIRLLKEVRLFEVSLVPLPMNPRAEITSAKSLDIDTAKEIKTKRDFEKALRDLGASKSAAVFLAGYFSEPEPSESEPDLKGLMAKLSELRTETQKFKEI